MPIRTNHRPTFHRIKARGTADTGAITAGGVVLALIVGIITAAAAGLYSAAAKPVYTSTSAVIFDQPLAIAKSVNAGVIEKLGRLRFKYAELMSTRDFASAVSADSGVGIGIVASGITAVPVGQGQTLRIRVHGSDASVAQRVATSAATVLRSTVATEQEQAKIPVDDRFVVRVIAPGSHAVKTSPTRKRILQVSGFAAAFAVLLILAAVQLPISRRR